MKHQPHQFSELLSQTWSYSRWFQDQIPTFLAWKGQQQISTTSKEKHLSFSRKLMRTLSHMCRMRGELSFTITDTRTTLRRVCANSDEQDLYNRISHLIHTLNSDWFQYLKLIDQGE